MYIDNYYRSYELAISYLNHKADVVETLRNNKKFLPKDIFHCKLRKEEIISKEESNGITVFKGRDLWDVRILSIKNMVPCTKKVAWSSFSEPRDICKKKTPVLLEYYEGRCGIDNFVQIYFNATTIRKGME